MAVTSVVQNLTIPHFPKFETEEYTTISTRWEKYKRRFNNLCVAVNVIDDKQKLALLLSYIGEECNDIYESLFPSGESETFPKAIKIFDEHFNPQSNITYEIYNFRKLHQLSDETTHQFFIRLKQQSVKCKFDDRADEELKHQIILATANTKLSRYAFQIVHEITPKTVSLLKTLLVIHFWKAITM